MESMDSFKVNIKKFEGKDFLLWKRKIQNAFVVFKCQDAFKADFKLGPDSVEVNGKAIYILMSTMKLIPSSKMDTAKDLWETLITKCEDKNFKNTLKVRNRLRTAKHNHH